MSAPKFHTDNEVYQFMFKLCLYQQFPLESGVLQVEHMLPVELFWAFLSIEYSLDHK